MSPPRSAAPVLDRRGLPTLGRYEILCEIASGGMAKVYLARVRGAGAFERLVAVKRCHPHLRKQNNYATMFLDEARLAARIHHPNVVSTVDVNDGEDLYMVMEYVEGDQLGALCEAAATAGSHLPLKVLLRIALDVLAGLDAAHELTDDAGRPLNVVHRDVSPQNILVGADGTTRVTDFGIAKDVKRRARATIGGAPRGKLPYMSPEQVNSKPLTRATDLFSLGVVLWESLTNQRLFDGDIETAVMLKIARGDYPAPSSARRDIPPAADQLVMRALAVRPEDRYRTAAEFADAIEQSGLEVASHRAVAACVGQLLGVTIARRRELLNRLRTPGGEVDLDELESTLLTPRSKSIAVAAKPNEAEQTLEDDPTDRDRDGDGDDDRTVKTGPEFMASIQSVVTPPPVRPVVPAAPAVPTSYTATNVPRSAPPSMAPPSMAPPAAAAYGAYAPGTFAPSVRPPRPSDTGPPVVVAPAPPQRLTLAHALYAISAVLVVVSVLLVSAAMHHTSTSANANANVNTNASVNPNPTATGSPLPALPPAVAPLATPTEPMLPREPVLAPPGTAPTPVAAVPAPGPIVAPAEPTRGGATVRRTHVVRAQHAGGHRNPEEFNPRQQ